VKSIEVPGSKGAKKIEFEGPYEERAWPLVKALFNLHKQPKANIFDGVPIAAKAIEEAVRAEREACARDAEDCIANGVVAVSAGEVANFLRNRKP
jgi:hypothetical protein